MASKTETGAVKVLINKNSFNRPTIKNTIRRVVQSPFDLSYYEFCIENKTKVTSGSRSIYAPVRRVYIEDPLGVLIEVWELKEDLSNCIMIDLDTFYLSKIDVDIASEEIPKITQIDTNIVPDKASPSIFDKFGASVIFYVYWLGIILLGKATVDWFRSK